MKFHILLLSLVMLSCTSGEESDGQVSEDSLIVVDTTLEVDEAVFSLKEVLQQNGFTIFNIIDHQQNAFDIHMKLPANTLILFGKPEAGTQLMRCDRRMGIELPLKILVFIGDEGQTHIAYWKMKDYAHYYELDECVELLEEINNTLANLLSQVSG